MNSSQIKTTQSEEGFHSFSALLDCSGLALDPLMTASPAGLLGNPSRFPLLHITAQKFGCQEEDEDEVMTLEALMLKATPPPTWQHSPHSQEAITQ